MDQKLIRALNTVLDTKVAKSAASTLRKATAAISEAKQEVSEEIGDKIVTVANRLEISIANAAKGATNFLRLDSSGLTVGNMTDSELGGNVQLTAEPAVNLRDGETVLASFTSDEIKMGMFDEFSPTAITIDADDDMPKISFFDGSACVKATAIEGATSVSIVGDNGQGIFINPNNAQSMSSRESVYLMASNASMQVGNLGWERKPDGTEWYPNGVAVSGVDVIRGMAPAFFNATVSVEFTNVSAGGYANGTATYTYEYEDAYGRTHAATILGIVGIRSTSSSLHAYGWEFDPSTGVVTIRVNNVDSSKHSGTVTATLLVAN